ncbi:uncharacterized protein LOC143146807 isoform X7 [Ptiloglossa arizonensis]|uniref:uncharacterized protein LOC143146807 isoform X7 n=1 Tax=Ptiloglossa arizonensis TaxID=3350558 RepID=UPI003F9FDA37
MVGRGSAARRNLSQSIRDSIWTRPVVLQRSRNSHVVSTSCFTTGNSTPPFVASTMIGCDEMENCSCPSRRAEMKKMQPSVDNVKFNENRVSVRFHAVPSITSNERRGRKMHGGIANRLAE